MTSCKKTDNVTFHDLVALMRKLRGPGGCPWDREQDHRSVRQCLVEETYEVIDAIELEDFDKLKEELGDLLFQVVFHAGMAEEARRFSIDDVISGISEKLTRRHPHVFGDTRVNDAGEVLRRWHQIKEMEKEKSEGEDRSVTDGIPRYLPALHKAYKLQKKVARVGFDWEKADDVVAKIEEELSEVKVAMANSDRSALSEELGDLLFSIVNLARFFTYNPEELLQSTIIKFTARFRQMERELVDHGKKIGECTLEEMDRVWNDLKAKPPQSG